MLAFIYIPVVQKELDVFRSTIWNSHRGTRQAKKELPDGIPDHIYHFPERYGGIQCGSQLDVSHLDELALLPSVYEESDDYLEPHFRDECERIIPSHENLEPQDASEALSF